MVSKHEDTIMTLVVIYVSSHLNRRMTIALLHHERLNDFDISWETQVVLSIFLLLWKSWEILTSFLMTKAKYLFLIARICSVTRLNTTGVRRIVAGIALVCFPKTFCFCCGKSMRNFFFQTLAFSANGIKRFSRNLVCYFVGDFSAVLIWLKHESFAAPRV